MVSIISFLRIVRAFRKVQPMKGFTIVELLIVIVVIGILAAIVIVAFNGVQNRANNVTVQSDLRNVGQKLGMYYANTGTYPSGATQLNSLEWKATQKAYQQNNAGNLLYCAYASGSSAKYVVGARSSNNTAYLYSSEGGISTYTGAWTGAWTDCSLFGFTTSDPTFTYSQGYHPPGWGTPGWKVWTGGTV